MESLSSEIPNFPNQVSEPQLYDEVSQNITKKAVRGPSFSIDEDRVLISAWLNIGMDPIKGNDQKLGTYWDRITEYYHKYKSFESERSDTMLKQRWGKIQLHVNKFSGCFAAITERNESGKNEQDKIADAKKLYEAQENVRFSLDHAWILLRQQPKWIQLCRELDNKNKNKKKSKRCATNVSSASTTDINGEDAFVDISDPLSRPPGNKVEKRKLKENTEKFEKIQMLHKEKRERDEVKIEIMKQRVEIDKKKLEIDMEKVRVKKHEAEMKIMSMDTSIMSEVEREYYSLLKMKILQGGL